MGSIRKREDNELLFFDFRVKGIRFREQTALPDNTANRKRLQKVLDHLEAEIAAGTFDYQRFFPGSKNAAKLCGALGFQTLAHSKKGVTADDSARSLSTVASTPLVKDFAEIWFAEKEVEWRNSHKKTLRADIDARIIPRWGEWEVGRITKADILTYRAELAKVQARGKQTVLSNRRVNRIVNLLRQIIGEASDRYDFRTPFQNIKQLKVKRTDVDPFTLDDVMKLIHTVRKDFKSYLVLRFFTGMRTGEIDGLKWKYVDFDRRLILVRETIVGGEEEYTKNDSSQRDIQMSQIVFDALKTQEVVTCGKTEFVFCTRTGQPLDNKNVTNRVWYPLLRHLGLALRRPYQTRHTAATLWLASGESPEWIARQMGHTTTEMLFRVYSRYVPNLTRQDGSAFERLLLKSGANLQANTAPSEPSHNHVEAHHE